MQWKNCWTNRPNNRDGSRNSYHIPKKEPRISGVLYKYLFLIKEATKYQSVDSLTQALLLPLLAVSCITTATLVGGLAI
jgi:hypothetical protein